MRDPVAEARAALAACDSDDPAACKRAALELAKAMTEEVTQGDAGQQPYPGAEEAVDVRSSM